MRSPGISKNEPLIEIIASIEGSFFPFPGESGMIRK